MGTSGAYGGSAGWSGTTGDTQGWLDAGGGTGAGGAGPPGDSNGGNHEPDAPAVLPGISAPAVPGLPKALISVLARIRAALTGGGGVGSGSGGVGSGGSTNSGGGRSVRRAASVGGRAVGGAYGARSGVAQPLEDLGLSLNDLAGLSKHQQARRIMDAAIGPSGALDQSELRLANAEVILWALSQESEPLPIELANRWVIEYVWQVWITEAGLVLRKHVANGYDSVRAEQEMRAVLEASISVQALPLDRPLTTADFERAIEGALGTLERVAGPES
jgi:hypothetical protein